MRPRLRERGVGPAAPAGAAGVVEIGAGWRDLFLRHAVPALLVDPSQGRIVDANEAAASLYGRSRERLRGTPLSALDARPAGALADDLARARSGGGPLVESRHRLADGSLRDVALAASPIRRGRRTLVHVAVHDVSARRRAEEARREDERRLVAGSHLAALGTLVAGVAHEINNPLGAALASTGFAAEEIDRLRRALREGRPVDPERTGRSLDEVAEALADAQAGDRRIAAIVKDLSIYGHPDPERKVVSLAGIAEGALRFVAPALRRSADVHVEDLGAPPVSASPGQMTHVVVDLLTNAIRAAAPGRRATVTVRVAPGPGGSAVLEVTDDGVGIPPEVAARMFDPFFTTRQPGEGMGLGLAIAQAIVTAHRGTIGASSEPGRGATFRVELPGASPEVVPQEPASRGAAPP